MRVLHLRQKSGLLLIAHIVVRKIDVTEAFRQAPVDPAGAPTFGDVVSVFTVVDFGFRFGCVLLILPDLRFLCMFGAVHI